MEESDADERAAYAKTPKDLIIHALQPYLAEIFDKFGKVVGPTHSTWSKAAARIRYKKSSRALYTAVQRNSYSVKDVLLDTVREESNNEFDNAVTHSAEECKISQEETLLLESDSDTTDSDNSERDVKKFNVTLTAEQWAEIKPVEKSYSRAEKSRRHLKSRTYRAFQSSIWRDYFAELVWKETKVRCVFMFRRSKIASSDRGMYLRTEARCTQCGAVLKIQRMCEPCSSVSVPVAFSCVIDGYDGSLHSNAKKRPLSGIKRKTVAADLLVTEEPASKYRRRQADGTMEFGDFEPPVLFTSAQLRTAKHAMSSSSRSHAHPAIALFMESTKYPLQHSVRCIGILPPFVHYWTPEQIQVWNNYHARTSSSTLAIDATGGLVKKLPCPSGELSKQMLLYLAVAKGERFHFPVCQMISSRHNTNAITFFLAEFVRSGGKVPKTAVMDDSLALLGACVRSFASCSSLSAYVMMCAVAVREAPSPDVKLPSCFIRIDVAHCLHTMARWKSLRKVLHKKHKKFLLTCLGQVITSESLTDIMDILRAMLIVVNSETDGRRPEDQVPTVAETCCNWLKERISSIAPPASLHEIVQDLIDNGFATDDDNAINGILYAGLDMEHPFQSWFENILTDAKETISQGGIGEHDNALYLPQLSDDLRRMASILPLWTAVMVPVFGYGGKTASSAIVEAEFGIVKHSTFKFKLPTRLDTFVQEHCKSISGSLKLAASAQMDQAERQLHEHAIGQAESAANISDDIDASTISPLLPVGRQIENSNMLDDIDASTISPLLPVGRQIENSNMLAGTDIGFHVRRVGEGEAFAMRQRNSRCPLCTGGNLPPLQGAHCCVACGMPVHALQECSLPIIEGDAGEGYGVPRKCVRCFMAQKQQETVSIELRHEEGWRKRKKKARRRSYLTSSSDWATANLRAVAPQISISVLRNGYGSNQKPAVLKKKGYIFSSTCAVDSIVQCLAVAAADRPAYSAYLARRLGEDSDLLALIKRLVGCKIGSHEYRLRAKLILLHEHNFQLEPVASGLTYVKCEATVTAIANSFLKDAPSLKRRSECNWSRCPTPILSNEQVVVAIKLQDLLGLAKGPESLADVVREICPTPCRRVSQMMEEGISPPAFIPCGGERLATSSFQEGHIILEVYGDNTGSSFEINRGLCCLHEIPSSLSVEGKYFELSAVIDFICPSGCAVVGHYTAVVRRTDGSFQLYDDLKMSSETLPSKEMVNPHLVLYCAV